MELNCIHFSYCAHIHTGTYTIFVHAHRAARPLHTLAASTYQFCLAMLPWGPGGRATIVHKLHHQFGHFVERQSLSHNNIGICVRKMSCMWQMSGAVKFGLGCPRTSKL